MFTGIINIIDEANPGFPRDMVVTSGWGSLSGYFKSEDGIGRYVFRVNSINDNIKESTDFEINIVKDTGNADQLVKEIKSNR